MSLSILPILNKYEDVKCWTIQNNAIIFYNAVLIVPFQVLLHAPEDPPLMEEWAFKVTPGAQTLVGVTMKKVS